LVRGSEALSVIHGVNWTSARLIILYKEMGVYDGVYWVYYTFEFAHIAKVSA
jgi:hypothetical protein